MRSEYTKGYNYVYDGDQVMITPRADSHHVVWQHIGQIGMVNIVPSAAGLLLVVRFPSGTEILVQRADILRVAPTE